MFFFTLDLNHPVDLTYFQRTANDEKQSNETFEKKSSNFFPIFWCRKHTLKHISSLENPRTFQMIPT